MWETDPGSGPRSDVRCKHMYMHLCGTDVSGIAAIGLQAIPCFHRAVKKGATDNTDPSGGLFASAEH